MNYKLFLLSLIAIIGMASTAFAGTICEETTLLY